MNRPAFQRLLSAAAFVVSGALVAVSACPAAETVLRPEVSGAEKPAPESSTRIAPADSTPKPESGPPPPTVGEPPAAPTAEDIALRDQRVLLRRGGISVDFTVSYSYSEQTLFPVVRTEQRTAGVSGTLRYGLLDDLQLNLRIPKVWRSTATYTDATIAGTNSPRKTHDDFFGGASVSLLAVAVREAVGRPNIILSVDGVAPGETGDRGVGGGLTLSKSYDPVVLFAGLSYLHGLSVDPADPRRSLAQHNISMNFGYTYALNDALALSAALLGIYRNSQSPDGISIPPSRERYQVQFGTTWMLARGLFIEPAVAIRLGGDSPDVTFSLNVPYTF